MAKRTNISVFNSAHSGYRRAGIAFAKGDNVVESPTEAQIQQIANDKRLVLQGASETESTTQTDMVGADNSLQQGVGEPAQITGDGSGEALPEIPPLAEVINTLAIDGTLELTKSGKPEVAQLEEVNQTSVSAAERDAAWEYYKQHLAEGEA